MGARAPGQGAADKALGKPREGAVGQGVLATVEAGGWHSGGQLTLAAGNVPSNSVTSPRTEVLTHPAM